jgi:hypothetical protein
MMNDPAVDIKKVEGLYASLDASLKTTKPGKAIELKIKESKMAPAPGAAPQPGAAPAPAN